MDQKIAERLQALPGEKRNELAKLLAQRRQSSKQQLSKQYYDVVIIGAGLAGGTLARQLKKADPTINLLLVEKHQYPMPEAAHKVGESSVELGSYYLRDVVGVAGHLETAQLPKAGLRYFFPTDDNLDITQRVELGCTKILPTPSHQIDRGRFENMLHEDNVKAGVDCWADCRVKRVVFGDTQHQISIMRAGKEEKVAARWVVDASGRASILKRQLGLQEDADHDPSAVWFRIDDEINVADWAEDSTWQARVPRYARRLSTTHLMGRGYWVWLIPLPSGATSVGIVADNKLHPHAEMNRFERAMDWLERYEPQCAQAIKVRQDKLQDFHALRHYAHNCQQVFSPQRWCLTGEAGVFVDPFYSPGTDFIGISNTLIADLILKDRRGCPIAQDADLYNRIYLAKFHSFLHTYVGQYPLMGNAQVMTAKVVWDFSIYWGGLALLFFHDKTQDIIFWQELRHILSRFNNLNIRMQQFFRDWDSMSAQSQWFPSFVNYMNVQFIHDLHVGLEDRLDDEKLKSKVVENLNLLEVIADEMFQHATLSFPSLNALHSPVEQRQVDSLENGHPGQEGYLNEIDNNNNHHLASTTSTGTGLYDYCTKYDVKEELSKIWLDVSEDIIVQYE